MGASLAGRRILVTRDAAKAGQTAAAIEERGGVAVVFPTIGFAAPEPTAPLLEALAAVHAFDYVVVTSPTGAAVLADGVGSSGLVPDAMGRPRFAAVGRSTAAALEKAGATGVLVPAREDGDGLLQALLADGASAGRVLVLRAQAGREVVIDGLRAAGGNVESVVAYRTVTASHTPEEVAALLGADALDAALFLSPSSLDGLFEILGDDAARRILRCALVVAIGPTTAMALEARGIKPGLVPSRPDLGVVLDGLADALAGRSDDSGRSS